MKRKFLTLLTLTFLIIIPYQSYAFEDIEGHWAENIISEAKEEKIINGYSNHTFKPNAYMTRAEFATAINRSLNLQTETDKYIPDVISDDWYYSEIRKSVAFGIMLGDENGNIHPNDYITREQAITMLSRAFCLYNSESPVRNQFLDSNAISDWAVQDVSNFVALNYIKGYEDNTIRPKAYITRAEVLVLLQRIVNDKLLNSTANKIYSNNVLILRKNVSLKNVEIYGNLIVGEGVADTLVLENVIVNGNMVLYHPVDFEKSVLKVKNKIIKQYESKVQSDLYYENQDYGIIISLPQNASAVLLEEINPSVYNKNDVIIIDIMQNDEYYFTAMPELCEKVIEKYQYDSIFKINHKGSIDGYDYAYFVDNANSNLIILKRDNIVYSLMLINVVSENLLDNIISNIQLVDGKYVVPHEEVVYRNAKLCLKFRYKDGYVGVDDSYNTGIVYNGDAFFKLFIQVNMITDMEDYSTSEIKYLLRTLIANDGDICKEEIKKVMNYDAISFEIDAENDKIISLYVIIGNNLYNFIFKGEKVKFEAIGYDVFQDIISSIEF